MSNAPQGAFYMGGYMVPTLEEIDQASKIENKEVDKAVKDYQEYKDK
jgi:hypothetical protein